MISIGHNHKCSQHRCCKYDFYRNFPISWSILERYGGILFDGHHRVGANSYPNTMAILTGEAAHPPGQRPDKGVFYIDEEFQFIQNSFKDQGYLRLHLEDFPAYPNFFRSGWCLVNIYEHLRLLIIYQIRDISIQGQACGVLLQICLSCYAKRKSEELFY